MVRLAWLNCISSWCLCLGLDSTQWIFLFGYTNVDQDKWRGWWWRPVQALLIGLYDWLLISSTVQTQWHYNCPFWWTEFVSQFPWPLGNDWKSIERVWWSRCMVWCGVLPYLRPDHCSPSECFHAQNIYKTVPCTPLDQSRTWMEPFIIYWRVKQMRAQKLWAGQSPDITLCSPGATYVNTPRRERIC